MADYNLYPPRKFTSATSANASPPVQSEHEFLYGESPHPAVVAHTAAVVERVQALQPPSLVKLDRGEQVIAAAVALFNLEIHGQGPGDEQWHKTREYLHGLTERYIEATS